MADPVRTTFLEPGVRIRPATPGDLEALHELDIAVFGRMEYPYFVLRQLIDLHCSCWLIAEDADRMRGYALAVPASDRSCGWLIGLGVRREYRRKGCGRELTVAALELLTRAGVPVAKLTVEPDNAPAIALYEELGFKAAELCVGYLGVGEDRILMEVELPAPAAQPPAAAGAG